MGTLVLAAISWDEESFPASDREVVIDPKRPVTKQAAQGAPVGAVRMALSAGCRDPRCVLVATELDLGVFEVEVLLRAQIATAGAATADPADVNGESAVCFRSGSLTGRGLWAELLN